MNEYEWKWMNSNENEWIRMKMNEFEWKVHKRRPLVCVCVCVWGRNMQHIFKAFL